MLVFLGVNSLPFLKVPSNKTQAFFSRGTVSKPCNGGSIGPAPVPQNFWPKNWTEFEVGNPMIFVFWEKVLNMKIWKFGGGGGPWKTIFFGFGWCLFCPSKLVSWRKSNWRPMRIRPTKKNAENWCLHLSESLVHHFLRIYVEKITTLVKCC